jgi:hypothetical protein
MHVRCRVPLLKIVPLDAVFLKFRRSKAATDLGPGLAFCGPNRSRAFHIELAGLKLLRERLVRVSNGLSSLPKSHSGRLQLLQSLWYGS